MTKKLTLLRYCSVLLLFLITVTFNSCRKEKEIFTPKQPPTGANVKYQKISYNDFLGSININSLGQLKSKMQNANAKNKVLSVTNSASGDFNFYTDSVQKFTSQNGTDYVFTMPLNSPRSVSFQNLTIHVDNSGTKAFIATYTPTKEWIVAKKNKENTLFKGSVYFTPINLENINQLPTPPSTQNSTSNGRVMSGGNKTMLLQTECYSYTIWAAFAYGCSDGNHMPWGTCPWNYGMPVPDGQYKAGYVMQEVTETACYLVDNGEPSGSGPSPGGGGSGGGTTPTPPGEYNPCDGSTPPPGNSGLKVQVGLKLMVKPVAPCDEGEGPVTPAYVLTQADRAILNEIAQEDAISDAYLVTNPLCYGTGRTGNVRWPGTAEHWLIQWDYVNQLQNVVREYSIPGAGSTPSTRGYADLVNLNTGEIFEIKPNNIAGIDNGTAEVTKYVEKAGQSCSTTSGAPFIKGTSYITKYFRHPYIPGKILKAELNSAGVIVYSTKNPEDVPQPIPVFLPQNLADKLKNFIRDLVQNTTKMEEKILAFLRVNPELIPYLKAAAAAIVVGTIIEDILTGGAGIADDWVSFIAARNLYRIALKI